MQAFPRRRFPVIAALLAGAVALTGVQAQESPLGWHRRMDRLEADIALAEDLRAIKRLLHAYGYYLDKGMWSDLAELFSDDAIARYPAGTFVGQDSIRRHVHRNVGGVELGDNGLGDNRLYNHMVFQPVVHIEPGRETAQGRWRVLATFGSLEGSATWAEGSYEMIYARRGGTWRIQELTYQSGFGAAYSTGWVAPGEDARERPTRVLAHAPDAPQAEACGGFPATCIGPFHYENPSVANAGAPWRSAEAVPRSREFNMTGTHGGRGAWSEGIFTNTFVNEDGVWKFASLRYYPTFISDYDAGWGRDPQPPPGPSRSVTPDRRPSETYDIFPSAHIPPYHYDNPVSGAAPRYPRVAGRPSDRAQRQVSEPVTASAQAASPAAMLQPPSEAAESAAMLRSPQALDRLLSRVEHAVYTVKDYHELENLKHIYGFYLDKNLWNDLADLFAEGGSMELAQRGRYIGRERVRNFLFNVFGDEGPVEGRLGNHIQMQPVIHVSADGCSAKIRSRMLQQLNFGPRASMGAAVYEDEAVKENGVWKFSKVHAYNTWGAGYDGGWMRSPSTRVPGPSSEYPPDEPPTLEFSMFPDVYELPFHYDNPITGRASNSPELHERMNSRSFDGYMPAEIAERLRAIGPEIDPPATSAIYAPLHASAPGADFARARDLSYGRHSRNVLDVFSMAGTDDTLAVVVFVHGGGFERGAKHTPGSPFYDNVMRWALGQDYVGVNINYRFAPEHAWPSGIEDLAAVIEWIDANIGQYGGDPEKLVLWGHSAGAAHVADYLAEQAREGRDDRVAAAVLLSGFYDLGTEVSAWENYYGSDVAQYPRRSSLPGLLESSTPLLVVDAELDPAAFQHQAAVLTDAFERAGKTLRRLHLAGHSHISEGYAIGTSDRTLTDPVSRFIEATLAAD